MPVFDLASWTTPVGISQAFDDSLLAASNMGSREEIK